MTYALDTNTVSYFIQGNTHVKAGIKKALESGHDIVTPPVTYCEVLRGFKHKPAPAKEKSFVEMCRAFPVGEMGMTTWDKAAGIYADSRRAGNPINDADILIAAFCLVNGYTLVTNNNRHFERVDGLQLANWTE